MQDYMDVLTHQPCSTYAVNSLNWSCIGLNLHMLHSRESVQRKQNMLPHMNKSATPHQGSESNMSGAQLKWHVKLALTGIWSWVSLDSNNSDQLCDVQASLDKWATDGVKLYSKIIIKKTTDQVKKHQSIEKNYCSWQICISYQFM